MPRRRTRLLFALAALLATILSIGQVAGADNPVAAAAARGDIERVRELLRDGADVNAPQGDGMTALHWAAARNDRPLAELLIYAGASLDAGTRIGHYQPLHIASREGHAAVVGALLQAGADPVARTSNSGATPLHLAAASGDAETLRLLVASGADVDAREGAWGQTPLIFAAGANRVDAIRVLLDAGADPSLHAASVDVVEMEAADKAADRLINQVLAELKDAEGGGPNWRPSPSQVQAAIEAGREIQRRWPDVPDYAPEDPDHDEDTAAITYNADGEPVGNVSAEAGDETKAKSYGELVGGWGGLTPLLHAVRQGYRDAALALIDGGAKIDQASLGDHTTPLLMAAINGQFDLALELIERGADPNIASDAGTTPLFAVLERTWAPKASYAHPVEHQQQQATYLDVMSALLEAGANPNARLNRHLWYSEYTFFVLSAAGMHYAGATPFWRAAQALDIDAMRLLREYGANPGIPTIKQPERRRRMPDENEESDHSGLPPVPVGGPFIYPIHAAAGAGYGQYFAANAHRHVPNGWMPAMRFLVEECGADVNLRDANGYNPVHHAASRGDNEMIMYLVERGADVTAVSRKGETTADMANGPIERVPPYPDTIELLMKLGSKNNNNCLSC